MRRQTQASDPGFGSDSFLDVLSNVVGILIILIVMAGMQLSRTPLHSNPGSEPLEPEQLAHSQPIQGELLADSPVGDDELPPDDPNPIADRDEVPEEVQAAMRTLAAERDGLLRQQADVEEQLAGLANTEQRLGGDLSRRDQEQGARTNQLVAERRRFRKVQDEVASQRRKLSAVLAEFEAVEQEAPNVKTIRHRLTPVSQEVSGEEIHFRLAGGRVSVVPLQELLERVKQQVERRREIAAARGGYKGTVGPIDGYSLEFVIEVRRMSPQEERIHGMREGYSLELSRCVVIPDPALQGETVAEALRRGSRFAMALRTASSGAALTLWTYPDSFGVYRELAEAAHAEGFLVAARPMPFGQNIIGDRRLGTRSAAQ
jgi:chaperonin cofactor prefoldin